MKLKANAIALDILNEILGPLIRLQIFVQWYDTIESMYCTDNE